MRTTIKIYLTAILLFVSFISFSQIGSNQILERTTINSFNLQSKELVGTSYINDDFLPAKLIDGEEIYYMRYNAYKDVFEVKRDDKIYYYLPKKFDYPVTFVGDKKIYQVFSYMENTNTTSGFFVVLTKEKNISLLLKEKINFHEEKKATSQLESYKPPTLKRAADMFFIGYKNNTATKLPKKKKAFLKLFSSKSKDVGTYIKRNKLGFKNKEDLIKIFKFYDSL